MKNYPKTKFGLPISIAELPQITERNRHKSPKKTERKIWLVYPFLFEIEGLNVLFPHIKNAFSDKMA
jgi:hypothetical protein